MRFSYYIVVSTFVLLLSVLIADALPVDSEGSSDDETINDAGLKLITSGNYDKTFEEALSSFLYLVPDLEDYGQTTQRIIKSHYKKFLQHITESLHSMLNSHESKWMMKTLWELVEYRRGYKFDHYQEFRMRDYNSFLTGLDNPPDIFDQSFCVLSPLISMLGTLPRNTKWDYFLEIKKWVQNNDLEICSIVDVVFEEKWDFWRRLKPWLRSDIVIEALEDLTIKLKPRLTNLKTSLSISKLEQEMFGTADEAENEYIVDSNKFSFELPVFRMTAFLSKVFNDALSTDIAQDIVNIAVKNTKNSHDSAVIEEGYKFMKRLSEKLQNPDYIKELLDDMRGNDVKTSSGITTIIMLAVKKVEVEDAKTFLQLMELMSSERGSDVFDQKEIVKELHTGYDKDKIKLAQIAFVEIFNLLSSTGAKQIMQDYLNAAEGSEVRRSSYTVGESSSYQQSYDDEGGSSSFSPQQSYGENYFRYL